MDEDDEGLTRSEVINEFGETIGNALIQGGFASLSAVEDASDKELRAVRGIGPAALEEIRG